MKSKPASARILGGGGSATNSSAGPFNCAPPAKSWGCRHFPRDQPFLGRGGAESSEGLPGTRVLGAGPSRLRPSCAAAADDFACQSLPRAAVTFAEPCASGPAPPAGPAPRAQRHRPARPSVRAAPPLPSPAGGFPSRAPKGQCRRGGGGGTQLGEGSAASAHRPAGRPLQVSRGRCTLGAAPRPHVRSPPRRASPQRTAPSAATRAHCADSSSAPCAGARLPRAGVPGPAAHRTPGVRPGSSRSPRPGGAARPPSGRSRRPSAAVAARPSRPRGRGPLSPPSPPAVPAERPGVAAAGGGASSLRGLRAAAERRVALACALRKAAAAPAPLGGGREAAHRGRSAPLPGNWPQRPANRARSISFRPGAGITSAPPPRPGPAPPAGAGLPDTGGRAEGPGAWRSLAAAGGRWESPGG